MTNPPPAAEGISRRDFLLLGAVGVGCAGCQATAGSGTHAAHVVDAGPASAFAAEGVISTFRDQGFFLIRKGGQWTALSSICTHRRCKVSAEPDRTYYCDCHGSAFDAAGKVTHGPAIRDLPRLTCAIDARGHLLVTVPA